MNREEPQQNSCSTQAPICLPENTSLQSVDTNPYNPESNEQCNQTSQQTSDEVGEFVNSNGTSEENPNTNTTTETTTPNTSPIDNNQPNGAYWRIVPGFYPPGTFAQNPQVYEITNQSHGNWQQPKQSLIPTGAYIEQYQESPLPYDNYNYQNMYMIHPLTQDAYNGNIVDYNTLPWAPHNILPHPSGPVIPHNYQGSFENQIPVKKSNTNGSKQFGHYDEYFNKDKVKTSGDQSNRAGNMAYRFKQNDPLFYNSPNTPNDINDNYQHKNANRTCQKAFHKHASPNSSQKSFSNYKHKKSPANTPTNVTTTLENNDSYKIKRYSEIVSGKQNNKTEESFNSNEVEATKTNDMNNNSTNYNNKNNVSKYKNKQTYDYNHSKNIPFYHNAYYDYPDNGMYKHSQFNTDPYYQGQVLDTNLLNKMMNISLASTYPHHTYYEPKKFNKSYPHHSKFNYHKDSSYTTSTNSHKTSYESYNPKDFLITNELEGARSSRFFVIKSYSKDDFIKSIKYNVWCSTEDGNRKLDKAFIESNNDKTSSVYLFFSVNGSGQFCGMAQMLSRVDYDSKSKIWSQDKWLGTIDIKWIFVKDVPNVKLRHILLKNNENKPVTNSRDTQEVMFDEAYQVLNVIRQHSARTSILDEFDNNEIDNNEIDIVQQQQQQHHHHSVKQN